MEEIQVTPEAFEEFKRLYEEDCPGHTKTDAELMEYAHALLNHIALIATPISEEDAETYKRIERGEYSIKELLEKM